jgi:hypothetical protein
MTALYALVGEYRGIMDAVESDDDASMDVRLAELNDAIEAKACGVSRILSNIKQDIDAHEKEIARLLYTKRRLETRHRKLRDYILSNMLALGVTKLQAGVTSFSVQNSPASVVVTDESLVPEECKRTKIVTEVDKRLVLEQYKKYGECAPGTEVVVTKRLVIR